MTQLQNSNRKRYVSVNVFHELLGHLSQATTRMAAKEMDVMVTSVFQQCQAWALGKAKNSNVSKTVNKCSTIFIVLLFIDIRPTVTSLGDKKHWLFIVNEFTVYMELLFERKKK